jgi:plastocyanin
MKSLFLRLGIATLSAVAAAGVIGAALPGYDAALAAPAPAAIVHIGNFTFNQQALAVKPGTTVTWVNDDDIPHTVVAKDKSFKSKVLDTGDRFSFTFVKPGQILYFCSLHPMMTGKVVVKA